MPPPRPKLLGRRFGQLTVLAEAGFRSSGSQRISCWQVRCACGTEKVVSGSSLRRSTSCGCLRKRPEPPPGKGWCGTCRSFKPLDAFSRLRSGPQGRSPRCRKCHEGRINRPQAQRARRKRERQVLQEAVAHYGRECACCGESQLEFLSLYGKPRKRNTGALARWLKKQNYPRGFRVLCRNCRTAKSTYGYCPHIILGR